MNRLAYRNFGDHQSLVVNHSVAAGSSVGVRWYEIRDPNGKPTVYQQGTYAPDSGFRWMGSVAMDQFGDLALGYSVSSPSTYPAVRYAGRVPTDPLGTLETEGSLVEGTGLQVNLSRWGDYSSMSVDPVDDCTFWYTNEYLNTVRSFNWKTRIASFRFPGCDSSPDFTLSAAPASESVVAGGSTTYAITVTPLNGFTGTVNFGVSGLPSGATVSFSPSPVTGSGSSTMTVNTASTTPGGGYTLTITATSGALVRMTNLALVVGCSGCGDFSVSAWPIAQTVQRGSNATFTVTVAPINGFMGNVTFSVSGLPAGTSSSFSPPSVTGSGSTVLTVTTTKSAPRGGFPFTITATSGALVHWAYPILMID